MKTIVMTTVAAMMLATTAMAADLPKKTATSKIPPVVRIAENNYYFGGSLGGRFDNDIDYEQYTLGVVAGKDVNNVLGAELTYDYLASDNGNEKGHAVFANGVARLENNTNVTPYVLAGVGHGWDRFNDTSLYNVGVGVRSKITNDVDLDIRYRRINDFDNNNPNDVATVGIIFKF